MQTVPLLRAGTSQTVEPKEVQSTEPAEPWEFKLAVPGWLAGASGQTGLHGHNANVDVGVGTILSKLNFAASLSAEARKGAFGVYGDFLYLSDQAGIFRQGMVSKVDFRVDEYLTDFDLDWRVLKGPWGWVDVVAGFRYTNLYNRLGLETDNSAIQTASTQLVEATDAQVRTILDSALRDVFDLNNPTLPIPPLAADQRELLLESIRSANADSGLAAAIRSGIQSRIAQAKSRVAQKIAGFLQEALNRNFVLSEAWVDPYVGLRARYNLSKAFYLTAKADVGGFSVGSKITTQLYGAFGCQLARNVYVEAGYRYLYVDYDQNGFLYKIATSGAQITVGVNF